MLKFQSMMKHDSEHSPISAKPDGAVMNPTFQDSMDGPAAHPHTNGSTYGSYQTLSNDNPTRSVSTISPVSKADVPTSGKTNPAFVHESSVDTDSGGVHVYPERNGHYVTKPSSRPHSKSPAHSSSNPQYSPSEDREVPAYYMPVNAHRKLLRGEILYVTKDTRNSGAKCWRRTICISGICLTVILAIILASLGATGVIFNTSSKKEELRMPALRSPAGLDVDVHEVQEVDNMDNSGQPKIAAAVIPSAVREPKADEALQEWRRQHPFELSADNGSVQSTRRPSAGGVTLAGLEAVSLPSDGVPEAIEGELRIMNMDFQAALADSKSWIFQYTSNDLTVYMNELFAKALNGANYNATRIMSLRSGSVIAKYQSLWNQAPQNWDVSVIAILNNHLDLNNNFIGNYLIDRNSLSAKSIFYTCRVDNGGCSHLCEFDLLEMRQYCLCPDNKTFKLINGTTCVRITGVVEQEAGTTKAPNMESATATSGLETLPTERSTHLITKTSVTEPETSGTRSSTATTVNIPFASSSSGQEHTATTTTLVSTSATTLTGMTFPLLQDHTVALNSTPGLTSLLPALSSESASVTVTTESVHTNTFPQPTATATTELLVAASTLESVHTPSPAMPMGHLDVAIIHPNETVQAESTHVVVSANSSAAFVALPVESTRNVSVANNTFFGFVPLDQENSQHEGWTMPPNTSTTADDGSDIHHESILAVSTTAAVATTVPTIPDTSPMTFATTAASQPLLTVTTTVPLILTTAPVTPPPVASVAIAVAQCYSDEFLCRKENRCVPHLVVCNGVPECQDGTDEANCTDCHPNFRCLSGACVPIGLVCDGMEDCSDGSDELGCTQSVCQKSGMFQCITGYCLENANRCDGAGDCYSMGLPVDELNCIGTDANHTCSGPNQFTCQQSRRCIPLHWRCNGRIDCLNQEDEVNCQCDVGKISCAGGGGCIDARLRCNGVVDCPDGYSDETDCFQLQNSGLVQARMLDTEWHNLCTDGWNQRAANNICQKLGYRPAMSVFTVPAPATDTGNIFWLKPDFNATQTLLQQLHITTPNTCLDPNSRAGITCERFRCQIANDPGVGNQVKLQSAIVKIMFEGDAFTVCNGYLVAPMWILTSASCLQNRPASTIKLTFYTNTFHTNVTAVHLHPNHLTVRMLHNYDFALLKVAGVVPANFVPVCLPSNSNPSLCKLAKLYDNSTVVASQLQRVAEMDCNSKRNYAGLVSGSMECWRSSLPMCDEDAVSPMICQSILGAWEIRGFLSYQHHCGYFTPKPLVFANLTYAVDWIRDLIGPALSNVPRTDESVFYPYMEPVAADSHVIFTTTAHELHTTITPPITTVTTTVTSRKTVHYDLDEVTAEYGNDTYNITTSAPVELSNSTTAGFAAVLFNVFGNITGVPVNTTVATMLVPDTTTSPSPFKLQCPDGTPLLTEYLCDGIFQCSDGWDEKPDICLNISCPAASHIRCTNGRCVDSRTVCDARAQCPAGASDEVGCKDCNMNTHFKCLGDRCIPLSWMCDGEKDCQYGDDESNQRCQVCANATNQFHCTYGGGCVPWEKVCDGAFDCPDFSDESQCARVNGTMGGVVEMRARGSEWMAVCDSGTTERNDQWGVGLCHDLGFDYANRTKAIGVGKRPGFVIGRDATTANVNLYLAAKNVTTECNGSLALSVNCGFQKRGNWQFDLTDLDPSVAYKAAPNEYRHIVLLVYLKGDLEDCVGVILNSRWILTSYECISQADPTMTPVDWALFSNPNSMDQGSFHLIRRFVAHPSVKFNIYFSKHDLVLVEAMESLKMGSSSEDNAAVWTPRSPVPLNASCVSYGYLYSITEIPGTRMSRRSEGQLYFWKTPLISPEQCNQASNYNGMITDSMLCGGFRNTTHRSPCMGRVDGAPVICRNANQLWEVVGIRSFQPVCDSLWMAPSVYTDIYQHRKWIGDVIGPYLTMSQMTTTE
ncbi:uncharacterized protein LOC129589217 isoform X2 [Paramacrobiotus metropolitanus]|uniref:uncharacterized protein LOC129589217 isoform X2 n=1 Tax=Paramacrobiotus metropolitanus TaxID=2943436 RepID=UPI00244607AD|nr:uncharacterized protein LOC129589217 isoform X2 [Paramacrobiotus metropolitanus]XP_055339786.1 uncharacterized protein LOC129589217 isoform X2 [Paramacrobiotus metropolitanus]XP_055339788.1 uncharacterized protein LOC129589217 isoform X2 [Paramacrobiotus metropolitanus]